LKERIWTGLIGGAAFITFLYIGGIWFASLISLLAFKGYFELMKMAKVNWISLPSLTGLIVLALIMMSTFSIQGMSYIDDLDRILITMVFLLLIFIVTSKNQFTFEKAGVITVSVIYIGIGFMQFVAVREHGFQTIGHEDGLFLLMFILFIIWSTDTFALFTGKYFGKTKLWPAISPNKTIEGSLGGILAAVLVGVLFQAIKPMFDTWGQVILITLITSIIGQLGDLVESAIKRYYDVKDSGSLLPGHGGVLDRFDSLLFVFIIFYLLQY
jgi:phosphatidate cytidylyltransferase